MAQDIIDLKAQGSFSPFALIETVPFAVGVFSLLLTVAALLMGFAVEWETGLYGWEVFLPFFLVLALVAFAVSLRHVVQVYLLGA